MLSMAEQWISIFAFRYALGSDTTAPLIIDEYIRNHITEYHISYLELFDKEISEFLKNYPECILHRGTWIDLRDNIRKELKMKKELL
jgi:hypothetical protein